jgi:hypothetical protein
MTKNSSKIKAGIRTLVFKPNEIISGTVVPGSTNGGAYTISVQPSDESQPIHGVMLNAITNDGNGLILFPKDGSDVIIGSIDGPGEWTVIRTSEILRAVITIERVTYELDSEQVKMQNGDVVFSVGSALFKMNTVSESLFQLLKDCFTYIAELTVTTSSGPSSTPVNAADFANLITRLNNLLTS